MVRALEMVAPGTALREGIENILHARTGGLIVIGEPDELSFLYSGGIKLDIDYTPALPLPGGEDGRRDHPQRERHEDHDGQRPADARSDDPLARDGHAPPHRRARLQADRRARDRDLPAPRGRLAVRRRRQVHPRGHPGRARQGQPGAGDARQVPHPPRPGLDAADGARVRGRRDAARRADGAAARGARHAHGGRDRALHRRARQRGAPDRDAARGDDGRHGGREGGARARLPVRRHRRGVRGGARADRPARPPGPARLRAARRAARLRPQAQHARLPGLAARLPHPRAHPAAAEARRRRDRRRVRRPRRAARRDRRRARDGRGSGRDPGEGHPRGPSPAAGDQPRGSLPADLQDWPARRGRPNKGGHHSATSNARGRARRRARGHTRRRVHRVRARRPRRLPPSRRRQGAEEGGDGDARRDAAST